MALTIPDLADKYARRIRAASRTRKLAESDQRESRRSKTRRLGDTVQDILDDIDGLVSDDTGKRISSGTRARLYGLVERELGVTAGQFRLLKEGSVQSAIEYERYITMLLNQLEKR